MNNRTLAIIKPDAVRNRLTGKIIDRILTAGFNILEMKQVHMTRDRAERFYAIHEEKAFFQDLVAFMSSGPCIVMVLERSNAVPALRELMGATDPGKAEKGTIRNEFATSIQENAVHGSDSNETAAKEIAFLFPTVEIPRS